MHAFKDKDGREWQVNLTIGDAKRVKNLLDVNLLEPEAGDPPLLTRLGTEEILLCDVIYCLVKPQADDRNISDEQFGIALGAAEILQAQEAFYAEWLDFFRGRGRNDRIKAIEAQQRMINLAVQKVEQEIDKIDLEAELEKTFQETRKESGKPFTGSPESSESTQPD